MSGGGGDGLGFFSPPESDPISNKCACITDTVKMI